MNKDAIATQLSNLFMNALQTKLPTDTWTIATWDEYIQATSNPAYKKAKCYYYNGQLRIEMSAVGPDHALDNGIIYFVVNLYCTIARIPIRGLINCSYREPGLRECQPDISYYIGERAALAPTGTSVVHLDSNTLPPDLAIEIASTSLDEDLGRKRLLYEVMQIREYWVVNVQQAQIIAFAIVDGGSRRITQSECLPGLEISLLEEALQRSRQMDDTQVGAWLLTQIQS
jgi:Uma2 family endonuclease